MTFILTLLAIILICIWLVGILVADTITERINLARFDRIVKEDTERNQFLATSL